ncbi:MAG: hypothetical protein A2161_14960 [Candidatus Schekmanbacteria bacterium RBG_13_48_7]|uniref:Xaa-Pro aminopeptidase n=1 Tax=Candidatus Schekmanbacteria bacterium RBG_13_48_7 TaxID=1817878 RepID=A0A1F7RW19_9BACT|nr:MAG: hypothetical protein A2161_14960 [Candidatus Schekmanbacteria bacterium RBG_13_48_7]
MMFEKRRKTYLKKTGDAVTILVGAKEKVKINDVHYRFRQDNDFYYLTGFDEPDAVAVLAPNHKEHQFILFVRPDDAEAETWHGRRYGPAQTMKKFGADIAFPLNKLDEELPKYFEGHHKLYYRFGDNEEFNRKLIRWIISLRVKYRSGKNVPLDVFDPSRIIHEMRLYKSTEEIARIVQAQKISADAYGKIMRTVKPGMFEFELETMLESHFRLNGGMGSGYATIVASHENGTILHYSENSRCMQDNELVIVDAGAEYDYYCADISRTFPVNGKFTKIQKEIYNIVLDAQISAINSVKPGVSIAEVHKTALKVLVKGLISLKIIGGPLQAALKKDDYKKFFMHGTSHLLGMDVHDVGRLKNDGQWLVLKPGMVLTVEPGLYFSSKIKGLQKMFKSIAVRIEDNILVTKNGSRNLTPSIPKTVQEIEEFMK